MILPISVYIIARNEADRIMTAIRSVNAWVDEVVVIDGESSDDTVQVAQSLGAKVVINQWPGYGIQKRFAEEQCKNNWLLNLDADEEMTSALKLEIQHLFAQGEPSKAGFIIQIRDLLPGETKLSRYAHTDFRIRLYNRKKARVRASENIDPVDVQTGVTAMLKNPMLHRSYRSLSHAIEKMNSYSSLQAKKLAEKPLAFAALRLMIEFPTAFFKTYILRGYIMRGRLGFIYATHYAYARFVRIAKFLEASSISNK